MRLVRLRTRGGRARLGRRSRGALVAASLALLATGCQMVGGSAGQAAGSQQITVAVVPGFANAPLQVAVEHGLFAQRHLDVTVQTYQNLQQAYGALTSGQADVISGDYAGLLYAQADEPHAQLRLIADGYDATPGVMEVLTLPGSAITAPQDLQGKAVATPPRELAPFSADAPYNVETLATEAVLQSDSVSPSSVLWTAMPPADMVTALRDHQVSAIVATQPYILQAETELGAVELFDVCSGVTASLPLSGYLHHRWLCQRSRRGPAGLPVRAHRGEGQHGSARDRPLGARDPAGDVGQEAALVTIGQYPTFLSVGQVQRVADLMYGTGMIRTTIPVKSLVLR